MQFLKDTELNNRAEKILVEELSKDTKIITGDGFKISSSEEFKTGMPILDKDESLVRLQRHKTDKMVFVKNKLTVDTLNTMIDYLAGTLAYDLYLFKIGEEAAKNKKFVITRTEPKTVFGETGEDTQACVHIEVLATLEQK